MPGGARELNIRMTIDKSDVDRKLDDFGHSADRATRRASEGTKGFERATKDAAKGVEGMETGLGGVNREMLSLIKGQIGLGAIRGLAAGIGAEWRRVADDIGKASKEWQRFRASLQGVASLSNKVNSNEFAKAEVDRAERAHVTPDAAKEFREAFLAKASLYVGEGPEAKMSTEDADLFQDAMMEYAASRGVSQKEMAGFAGGLLDQQKGKTTAAEMKTRAGKVFATLEASSAPVAHLLPGVTRVMAQGFSAEEAAPKMAQLPSIAPEEESTHMLGVVAQLRKARMAGKLEDFGVTDEMTPNQMLDTVVRELDKRAGQGKGRGKRMDEQLKSITDYHIAQDTLRGLADQGGAGLDRWRNLIEKTPANVVDTVIAEDRKSEPGLQRASESRAAAEEERMGLRGDPIARRRLDAETDLKRDRAFEGIDWRQLPQMINPTADDMKTRQINKRMIVNARRELGEAPMPSDDLTSASRITTDALLRQLLKRIEEQNEMMKSDRKDQKGPPAALPGRPTPQATRP